MADKIITDADVIEQIRNALPEVTESKKGLSGTSTLKAIRYRSVYIRSKETVNIGRVCGLLTARCITLNGTPSVYLVSDYPFHAQKIAGPDSTLIFSSGGIEDYRGTICIKNDSQYDVTYNLTYQVLD